MLEIAPFGEENLAREDERHVHEAAGLGTPVGVIGIGDSAFGFAGALIVLPQEGEAFAVGVGKRAEEGGVGEAEDGGVGADAESEGEHGDSSEARRFAQHAQAMAQVLNQCAHTVSCLYAEEHAGAIVSQEIRGTPDVPTVPDRWSAIRK